MGLPPPDFESGASASSATPAVDTALTQFRVLSCSLHREPSDLSPLRLPFRHSGARLVLRRDDSLDVSLLGEHALREVQPLLDVGEPSLHVLERVEAGLHAVTAAHPPPQGFAPLGPVAPGPPPPARRSKRAPPPPPPPGAPPRPPAETHTPGP